MRSVSTVVAFISVLGIFLFPETGFAIPTLQLDIVGGVYDETTETIIAPPGEELTLVALLTPKPKDLPEALGTEYFISAALLPTVEGASDLGSFTFQTDDETAVTVDATADMDFGVPPHEPLQAFDAQDLSQHGIFETYFAEFAFMFDPNNAAATYNTQDTPGGDLDFGGAGSFYQFFTINTSLLDQSINLHFDLYSTKLVDGVGRRGPQSLTEGEADLLDRDLFAPFSHDAETTRRAPEPATLLLLGAGLAVIAAGRSRKLWR